MEYVFTLGEFRSIASLAVAASKDAVTPAIMGINIHITGGMVEASATDRYRVARLKIDNREDEMFNVSMGFTIFATEIVAFGKMIAKESDHMVHIMLDNKVGDEYRAYELSCGGFTSKGNLITLSYPPVSKLVDEARFRENVGATDISLNPEFVASLTKLIHPLDSKRNGGKTQWKFSFTHTDGNGHGYKPSPVYIQRDGDGGAGKYVLDYLLQPMYVVR